MHIHADRKNKNLVNSALLDDAKDGLYLVNTSRGEIVCEEAVAMSIKSGKLAGYATDVLDSEFERIESSPILQLYDQRLYNIIITPHVGGMTFEGQEKAFMYALNKFNL